MSETPHIDKQILAEKLKSAINPSLSMPKVMAAFFEAAKEHPESAAALEAEMKKHQDKTKSTRSF